MRWGSSLLDAFVSVLFGSEAGYLCASNNPVANCACPVFFQLPIRETAKSVQTPGNAQFELCKDCNQGGPTRSQAEFDCRTESKCEAAEVVESTIDPKRNEPPRWRWYTPKGHIDPRKEACLSNVQAMEEDCNSRERKPSFAKLAERTVAMNSKSWRRSRTETSWCSKLNICANPLFDGQHVGETGTGDVWLP